MKLVVERSNLTWQSPDKQRTIWTINGQYKTYSKEIGEAQPGAEFDVEVYEKDGRNGPEKFVKQAKQGFGMAAPASPNRDRLMILSYAKDLTVAEMANSAVEDPVAATLEKADRLAAWANL